MKKMIFSVLMVLTLSLTISSLAHAIGGRGSSRGHSITVNKYEVVFHVTPAQFRKAKSLYLQKYPGYKCGGWEYDYDDQEYSCQCFKGKKENTLTLLMDGSIMVTTNTSINDYKKEQVEKKIGIWE